MKRISTLPFSSHQNYIGQESFSLEKWSLAKYLLDPFTPASLFPVPPPPANTDTIPMATPFLLSNILLLLCCLGDSAPYRNLTWWLPQLQRMTFETWVVLTQKLLGQVLLHTVGDS